MIPVVMLVINTRTLSSVFLTIFCLTMTCPSLHHIPVTYLMAVAVTAIVHLKFLEMGLELFPVLLINILAATLLTHLTFSLLINIYATSLIALKAWFVHLDSVTGNVSLTAP
jgi:hypothetical protein